MPSRLQLSFIPVSTMMSVSIMAVVAVRCNDHPSDLQPVSAWAQLAARCPAGLLIPRSQVRVLPRYWFDKADEIDCSLSIGEQASRMSTMLLRK
jgi:hypothetical protein